MKHGLAIQKSWRGISPAYVFLGGMMIALLLLVGAFVQRAYADDDVRQEGERIITLYDRGVERSFITTAATVGLALEAADIEVDTRDRVEPSLDEELVADSYTVNVYRARPLLVVDGMYRSVVMTAARTPAQVATDTGVVLYDEDNTVFEQSSNLLADGAAERFVVERATEFIFTLYGETFTARTQATTVGEMLEEKGISLAQNDRASVALDEPVMSGMKLRVWREGKQTITVDEKVDFETEQIRDANRDIGYKEVRTPGIAGEALVTYEVTIQDGEEVARKKINSIIKKQPTKQVEIIGTKVAPVTGTCGEWMAAAGINHPDANFLIGKESGCNPRAVNPSSGACGIPQSLPCSKMGPVNPDGTSAVSPEGQLRWMDSYVHGRYGSWEGARSFWERNRWY